MTLQLVKLQGTVVFNFEKWEYWHNLKINQRGQCELTGSTLFMILIFNLHGNTEIHLHLCLQSGHLPRNTDAGMHSVNYCNMY